MPLSKEMDQMRKIEALHRSVADGSTVYTSRQIMDVTKVLCKQFTIFETQGTRVKAAGKLSGLIDTARERGMISEGEHKRLDGYINEAMVGNYDWDDITAGAYVIVRAYREQYNPPYTDDCFIMTTHTLRLLYAVKLTKIFWSQLTSPLGVDLIKQRIGELAVEYAHGYTNQFVGINHLLNVLHEIGYLEKEELTLAFMERLVTGYRDQTKSREDLVTDILGEMGIHAEDMHKHQYLREELETAIGQTEVFRDAGQNDLENG